MSSTSNQTSNFTNYIPPVDITADNCCMEEQEFLNNEEMEPIKLTNLNLNELNQAQSKLQQFDEELQRRINQPFFSSHSKWYNVLLGIIATMCLMLLFCWCCCRKCRFLFPFFNFFRRCFCHNGCHSLVCINSHNKVRNGSVASYTEPNPVRMSSIARRPRIPTPRGSIAFDNVTYEDHDHYYEEPEPVEVPSRPTPSKTFKL